MPKFVHNLFLIYLPKILFIKTIDEEEKTELELKSLSLLDSGVSAIKNLSSIYENSNIFKYGEYGLVVKPLKKKKPKEKQPNKFKKLITENIYYLNEIINSMENDFNCKKVIQQWRLLAFVLDRVVFLIFGSAFLIGTFYIFLQAPSLYYDRIKAENNICFTDDE